MKDLKNHSDACASINTRMRPRKGFAPCDCHKKHPVLKMISLAIVIAAFSAAFNPAWCPEDKVRVSKGWTPAGTQAGANPLYKNSMATFYPRKAEHSVVINRSSAQLVLAWWSGIWNKK